MKTKITLTIDEDFKSQLEQTEKLYKIGELSPEAKEKALNDWRNGETEFFWQKEYQDTLTAFCKEFNLDWRKYDFERNYILFDYHMEDNILDLSYIRLWKYLQNQVLPQKNKHGHKMLDGQCYFTGFCADEDILDPIRKFIEKPHKIDFRDLLGDCLYSWLKALQADYEYSISDEAITETIDNNDYDFTENGELA